MRSREVRFLTLEEETDLYNKYITNDDNESLHRIVEAYMPLIGKIEKGLRGYGMDTEDMVNEGVIAFINALERFDQSKGNRLSTFVAPFVKSAMYEFVFKNKNIVKTITTREHRRAFFNLDNYKNSNGVITEESLSNFAKDYNMSLSQAKDALARLRTSYVPASTGSDYEDESNTYVHDVVAQTESPETSIVNSQQQSLSIKALYEAIPTLNDRERDILNKRWLDSEKKTLSSLSEDYGVSLERIRQIERQAIKRLASYINENYEL